MVNVWEDDEEWCNSVRLLGEVLASLLVKKTGRVWKVTGNYQNLDFQYSCYCDSFFRKTRSLDFGMASTALGWIELLDKQAEELAIVYQRNTPDISMTAGYCGNVNGLGCDLDVP